MVPRRPPLRFGLTDPAALSLGSALLSAERSGAAYPLLGGVARAGGLPRSLRLEKGLVRQGWEEQSRTASLLPRCEQRASACVGGVRARGEATPAAEEQGFGRAKELGFDFFSSVRNPWLLICMCWSSIWAFLLLLLLRRRMELPCGEKSSRTAPSPPLLAGRAAAAAQRVGKIGGGKIFFYRGLRVDFM